MVWVCWSISGLCTIVLVLLNGSFEKRFIIHIYIYQQKTSGPHYKNNNLINPIGHPYKLQIQILMAVNSVLRGTRSF